jgi:hypothetical protein
MAETPFDQRARPFPFHFIAIVTLVVIWTFRLPNLEGWDDRFYVSQMVSVVSDGDLMLHDDLLAFDNVTEGARLRTIADMNPVRAGALSNNFGVGPAVIHSFYMWPRLIGTPGLPSSLRAASALGSMVLLVLLLLAIRTLLVDLGFSPFAAGASALLAVYAGPLAVYGTRLQMNSHLPSALCGTLLFWLAWSYRQEGGTVTASLLGLVAGLCAIVRFQDGVVPLLLAPFLLTRLKLSAERRRTIKELGLAAVMALVVLVIQALALDRHNSQIEGIPQGPSYMNWTQPHVGNFLLSPVHGLFPWAPLFGLGLAALIYAATRAKGDEKRLFMASLFVIAVVQCYVSAAPKDWWGGSSFGPRRLATITAAAAVGLATIGSTVPRSLAQIGALAATAWSIIVTWLFSLHFDDLSLVFAGRLSNESPFELSEYANPASLTWATFRQFSTETFSLVDHTPPSVLERLSGAAVCILVCGLAALSWRAFVGSSRLRAVVATVVLLWVFVWTFALWRAPSNRDVNAAWFAMDQGQAGEERLETLQPEVAAAGRVLLAWRAVRSGRVEEGRALLSRARSPHFPTIGLAEMALLDEAVVRKGEH